MKFGLFYELQLPKPYDADTWDPDAETRIINEMLDQCELADSLGFDYVFEVEHHFLEEYSHSSAPELVLAALSQRTKNMRLGHGIALSPPGYNHPARTAERVATLDRLSGGRVEWGTGESSSDQELGGFGVDRTLKKAMWEETVREMAKMMDHEPYEGFEGEFFSMPSRNVIPKPIQRPHPPLWVASSRRETTMVAARMGIGSLGFAFETPEECNERVTSYFELLREECFPIGQAMNPALAVLSSFMCAPTDEEAVRRSADGPGFFSHSLAYYYNPMSGPYHKPGKKNLWREYSDLTPEQKQNAGGVFSGFGGAALNARGDEEPEDEVQRALWRAAKRGGSIGTPDFIRDSMKKYEDAHLDLMIFVAQAGNRKHEDIMESIDLFGRQVLPEFKERHEKHQRWRAEQLAGLEFPVNSSI
jgi:alkanesulfonate monooxygenase SsuD/methylene tetrahydromethanopterin reductase-like flavin-dependent oxidoreductase (luciferase family)